MSAAPRLAPAAAVLVLGIGAACTHADREPDDPTPAPKEPEPPVRVEQPPVEQPSASEPSPKSAPPPTAAPFFEDLAIAWSSADNKGADTRFLCDSLADWVQMFDEPCITQEKLWVVDEFGAREWAVEPEGHSVNLRLDAQPRPKDAGFLVASRQAPDANARLEPAKPVRKKKSAKAFHEKVVAQLRNEEYFEDLEASAVPMSIVQSIQGDFGGGIDEVVVLQVTGGRDADGEPSELVNSQALAGLKQGEYVGLFGADEHLTFFDHQPIAITDLDGDGHSEILWWTVRQGVGAQISYVEAGVPKVELLFTCQCGDAFESHYPGPPRKGMRGRSRR